MRILLPLLLPAAVACAEDETAPPELQPGIVPPLAPHAKAAERDGKKLVVNLDHEGKITIRRKIVTLVQVEEAVKGDRVMVRADHRAPWLHVAMVLTALARKRVKHVEFAVARTADRRWSEEEAKRLGAERKDVEASAKPKYDGVLALDLGPWRRLQPQPAGRKPTELFLIPVKIRGAKPRFHIGREEGTESASELEKSVRRQVKHIGLVPGAKTLGVLTAESTTPFSEVVAVLDRFAAAKLDDADWLPIVQARKEAREAKSLPKPEKAKVLRPVGETD